MKNAHMIQEIRTGALYVLVGLFLFAGVAFAANFVQPTQNFPGGNAEALLDVSDTDQVKLGNLQAGTIKGYNIKGDSVCIGSDCRSSWPTLSGSTLSTNCRINTKIITDRNSNRSDGDDKWPHGTQSLRIPGKTQIGSQCDAHLTTSQKNAGWMTVSHDQCPGVQGGDCAGAGYCQYIQVVCDEGLTFVQGDQIKRDTSGSAVGGGSGGGGGSGDGGGGDGGLQLN